VIFRKHGNGHGKMRKPLDGLLDILVDATISFLSLQAQSGAQTLMLFDSWASAVPAGAA
jgi:uroporphyrinogen-III decarboxylase